MRRAVALDHSSEHLCCHAYPQVLWAWGYASKQSSPETPTASPERNDFASQLTEHDLDSVTAVGGGAILIPKLKVPNFTGGQHDSLWKGPEIWAEGHLAASIRSQNRAPV